MKLTGLAAAAALLAVTGIAVPAQAQIAPPARVEVYTNMPQVDPGDNPANWSARQNVVESNRYERLTHTSPGFRAARIRKECGPITEPGLYQQCVATFGE
jgi:ABC-type transport system substrate-binding protein